MDGRAFRGYRVATNSIRKTWRLSRRGSPVIGRSDSVQAFKPDRGAAGPEVELWRLILADAGQHGEGDEVTAFDGHPDAARLVERPRHDLQARDHGFLREDAEDGAPVDPAPLSRAGRWRRQLLRVRPSALVPDRDLRANGGRLRHHQHALDCGEPIQALTADVGAPGWSRRSGREAIHATRFVGVTQGAFPLTEVGQRRGCASRRPIGASPVADEQHLFASGDRDRAAAPARDPSPVRRRPPLPDRRYWATTARGLRPGSPAADTVPAGPARTPTRTTRRPRLPAPSSSGAPARCCRARERRREAATVHNGWVPACPHC